MSAVRRFMERHATGRLLIVLLLILVAVLVSVQALDVPWSLVHLKRITGGASILDMQFHYSAKGARDLLTALGPDGRAFYLWPELTVTDVVLPALFATVLTVAMAVSFRGVIDEHSAWRRAQWLPLLAMILDYAENGLIAKLVMDFPLEHPGLATAAGWTTTAKHLVYLMCVVICIARPVRLLASLRAPMNSEP